MEKLDDTFADLAYFSLVNAFNETAEVGGAGDYTFFIYLGVALLLIIIGLFIYKFYFNQKKVRFDDNIENNELCHGETCPI
jgi:hypothetical protein